MRITLHQVITKMVVLYNIIINNIRSKKRSSQFFGPAQESSGLERAPLADQIKAAHGDWQAAVNIFNYCAEQDMIDYAIYNINATEKRYICLLKIARQEDQHEQMKG